MRKVKEVCKNCLCYNNGWCMALGGAMKPNAKGCFGFIPNDHKEDNNERKENP